MVSVSQKPLTIKKEITKEEKPVYLIVPEALKYKGIVRYEKYALPKGLGKYTIAKLFVELKREVPGLLALLYNPKTGELIVWYVKTQTLAIPLLPILIGTIGVIAGMVTMKLLESGEGPWDAQNPPGLGLSIWDLIKLGLLAFVVYMFAKAITDVIIAIRESKPMPSPWEVYVAPAVPYVERAAEYVKPVVERVIR